MTWRYVPIVWVALGGFGCRPRAATPHASRSRPVVIAVAPDVVQSRPRSLDWTGAVRVHVDSADTRDPRVAVHIPSGLDPAARLNLVVYFHGSFLCAAEFVWNGAFDRTLCPNPAPVEIGAGGAGRHDAAGTASILIAPQLFTGDDRRFREPRYFRALLDAIARGVISERLGVAHTYDDVDRIVLVGHSRGNRALDHVLAYGGIADKVLGIVLMDGVAQYTQWLSAAAPDRPRRIVSVHAGVAAAHLESAALAREWSRGHPNDVTENGEPLTEAARSHTVTVLSSPCDYGWISLLYLTKALRGIGLPAREIDPPPWTAMTPSEPAPIAVGGSVHGEFVAGDPALQDASRYRDFALALGAGESIEIRLDGERSRSEPTSLDVRLHLFRVGVLVATDDDGGAALRRGRGSFDSRIVYRATTAGTYIVRASTFGSGMRLGSWRLEINGAP